VSFESVYWENVSDNGIDFIRSLLLLNPEHRPRAIELHEHPWLKMMKRKSSLGIAEAPLSPNVVKGLVSFNELSASSKFFREIISYTLQPDQISGLQEEFEKIDIEGKGEISLSCFKAALVGNNSDLTELEIESIFNGIKVRNTDVSIRWHEFIAACLSQCRIDNRNIRLAFDRIDNERKGYIILKDLQNAMDFFGSDSRYDLQSIWVNYIIDYKRDKQHMTFEDFYELLQLDKGREDLSSSSSNRPIKQLSRKGISAKGRKSRLVQSTICTDKDKLNWLDSSLNSRESKESGSRCGSTLSEILDLNMKKTHPNIRNNETSSPIISSSMKKDRINGGFPKSMRRASMTGGLFMKRNSQEENFLQISRTCSGDM